MSIVICMIIAGVSIGSLIPEFILMLSPRTDIVRMPFLHNIMMGYSVGVIFGFIALQYL